MKFQENSYKILQCIKFQVTKQLETLHCIKFQENSLKILYCNKF